MLKIPKIILSILFFITVISSENVIAEEMYSKGPQLDFLLDVKDQNNGFTIQKNSQEQAIYEWGSATCLLENNTLIISDGIITDSDTPIWNISGNGSVALTIQNVVFENSIYRGSMANLFNSKGLLYLKSVDFSGLDTSEVTSMDTLFSNLNNNLQQVTFGDNFSKESTIKSTKYMFKSCPRLKSVNLTGLNTTNVENMQGMFSDCTNLEELILGDFQTSNVIDMSSMFYKCYSLESIDLNNFQTSNVTNMSFMFCYCYSLESIDLRNFDTQNVITMESMFASCKNIQRLDVSNFNTSNVNSFEAMFFGCTGLSSLNLVNFNTSKAKTMYDMFGECYYLIEINLGNWDHQPMLENTSRMFRTCQALESLNMKNFDTHNVKNMKEMFTGASKLKSLDVSSFDTSNVTNYSELFRSMTLLENLNISNFNTRSANIKMDNMLAYTSNLKSITLGPNTFLNESTKLPPIQGGGDDTTGRPESWVSTKNLTTYISTKDFLNKYEHKEENEDTYVRGYPYQVQYYDNNTKELLHAKYEITHEKFFLENHETPRQNILSWMLEGKDLVIGESQMNLGIEVTKTPKLGQVTKIYGEMKDKEADVEVYWASNESDILSLTQDKSIGFVEDKVYFRPSIDLDAALVTEKEKEIHYKIEVVHSNEDVVIDTIFTKANVNEMNEVEFNLNTESLGYDKQNVRLDFYQLSFTDNKTPINVKANSHLFIDLFIFGSFKITYNTNLLKWELLKSESKGLLERKVDNEIRLDVLNSQFINSPWRVNVQINAPEPPPFKFRWRQDPSDRGQVLELGNPFVVMTNESSQTIDQYNHYNTWGSDSGLLIETDAPIEEGTYGKDVTVRWIVEQAPNFS